MTAAALAAAGPLALVGPPAPDPDRWSLAPPPARAPVLADDVDRFLAALAARRALSTVATYRWILRRFARALAAPAVVGADLTPEHAAAFIRGLARGGAPPATLRLHASALARFYAFLGRPWVRGLAAAGAATPNGPPAASPRPAGGPPIVLPPGVRPDEHPAVVYLATLPSPRSRESMRAHLHGAARLLSGGRHDAWSFPWAELTYGAVVGLRTALARRYKRRTVNARLAAVRGVLRQCWALGLVDAERLERVRLVKGVKGQEIPAGRALAPGELPALLAACRRDPTPVGARDRALIALLYACGVRASELCGLDLADHDPAAGTLAVRLGKGRKERLLPLHDAAAAHLADWLAVRGDAPGPLFVALDRAAGLRAERRLTAQSVRDAVARRAAAAGAPPLRPHDLRRSFISALLEAGVDLATVQKLAGHADPETTSAYDRRPFGARRAAVARLDVPL